MRRTIVVADRDERLRQAFMTVFSKEHYDIIYAPNGKEVEKLAVRMKPDIYVVNVDLPKRNGVEVHQRLQRDGYLDRASFFFLKDENDKTELLACQADGIIQKPINFFKLYETITSEDEVIELTDLVEEKDAGAPRETRERPVEAVDAAPSAFTIAKRVKEVETKRKEATPDVPLPDTVAKRLREAMDDVSGPAAGTGMELLAEDRPDVRPELEQQFKAVLGQAMEEAANKLSARLAPVLTQYVEDYVKKMLLEITEKVIREEIDKLLKESAE